MLNLGYINDRNSFRRLFIRARIMNLTKTESWLRRYYEKGFISNINNDVDFENLIELVNLFNRKYGDDWDIEISNIRNNKVELAFAVLYKNITISNTNGRTHEIKDLIAYFHLYKVEGVIHFSKISAKRFTLSEDEWSSGYGHSHLNTFPSYMNNLNDIFSMNSHYTFCLGESELSELIMINSTEFDIGSIELMLYTFDTYLEWESLEGGPYILMSNIVTQQSNTLFKPNILVNHFMDEIVKSVFLNTKTYGTFTLDYYFDENRYKVLNNQKLNDFLIELAPVIPDLLQCLVKKVNGEYFIPKQYVKTSNHYSNEDKNKFIKKKNKYFTFISGKKIEFNIISNNATEEEDVLSEFKLHPILLDYVIKQFELKLYSKAIRNSGIQKCRNSSNNVSDNIR